MWVIAGIRGERAAELALRFDAAIAKHASRPQVQDAWRAWAETPELVPGLFPDPRPGQPNMVAPLREAVAFNELAFDMVWDASEASGLEHECMSAFEAGAESFVVSVRKGSPVAALFHGIGPDRARTLPGWFGNFLLTPGEVHAQRSQVEATLTIPAGDYERVRGRVRDWLNGMGDSGDTEAENLLSGPMRCWRVADEAGLGLCALQFWV